MSHPNHERANKLYVQLLRSKSRTDANVLVALRGGLVVVQRSALGVTSWYFDGRRAEAAVGDQYAPGRVRSQAECRVWRRMVDLELAEKLPPLRLTGFGRLIATKASDDVFVTTVQSEPA